MKEYKVTEISFSMRPDPKEAQKQCDEMAGAGWRLASSAASQSSGGRVLMFWEREKA